MSNKTILELRKNPIQYGASNKMKLFQQSKILKIATIDANSNKEGQYWWCCKCGTCNEGSYGCKSKLRKKYVIQREQKRKRYDKRRIYGTCLGEI